MLKVGLTGGIACGKSKALSCFERLGSHVIDADRIARNVVRIGKPAYEQILEEFGTSYLTSDGELDRAKLANLIFKEESARLALNAIVHPYVLAEEKRRVQEIEQRPPAHPVVVTDAALMVEVGTYTGYDVVVAVYCPPAVQLERLMKRNRFSRVEAQLRMESQMPLLEKIKLVDYVIDTAGDYSMTQEQISYLYRELILRYGTPS